MHVFVYEHEFSGKYGVYNILLCVAEEFFVKLDRAKEVLVDKEKRSKYDQWRNGGFSSWISFDNWMAIQSRVHTVSTSRIEPSSLPKGCLYTTSKALQHLQLANC